MKKTKRVLAFGLSLFMTVGVFSSLGACNEPSAEEQTNETEITFANFEQWGPDFQLLRLINNFGKVTRNEDKAFVKEGNYSAKLQPLGGYLTPSQPLLYLPTQSSEFAYNYTDFTQYDRITAYMYNAEEKPLTATIGLVSAIGSPTTVSTAVGDTVYLQPKEWTRIDYWLELDLLSLSADVTNIKGVYFQFNNAGVLYPDEAPTVYLDDVRLVKAEQQRTVNDLVTLKENEICDFETDYQKYVMQAERAGTVNETFEMDVVKAADYGITASSGENVLRLLRHPSTSSGNSRLMIPESVMKKAGLDKIAEADYKKTYFCFDMRYGENPRNEYLGTQVTMAGGTGRTWTRRIVRKAGEYMLNSNGQKIDKGVVGQWAPWNYSVKPGTGQWATYKISLFEIAKWCGADYVNNPGYFGILISNYSGTQDSELFFDNFRLETGEEIYVDASIG